MFLLISFILALQRNILGQAQSLTTYQDTPTNHPLTLGKLSQGASNENYQLGKLKQIPVLTQSNNDNDLINPNFSSFVSQLSTDSDSTWAKYNAGFMQYQAGTKLFNSYLAMQEVCCQGCNTIRHVAFRLHSKQLYLQANNIYLTLNNSKSPKPEQLFTAIQNIDCTWSFKTTKDTYISLNLDYNYLTLKHSITASQRFYMERKEDWIYIQSANSYRMFWIAKNNRGSYGLNQAARWVMELWPAKKNGWN